MPSVSEETKKKAAESEEAEPQPLKSYRTILKQEIIAGLIELERPVSGLFLSSLSAGLDIGFSVLLMATVLTFATGTYSDVTVKILVANMYSAGFILVLLGRSELFTEHTTLAVLPMLDGQASLGQVARVWTVVFVGNILGAGLFAFVAWWIGPALRIFEPWALEAIAKPLLSHRWWVMLISATLAGWLMGELAWLIAAGRDTISQVFFVWLITTIIGLLSLHHTVAGAVEVAAGVLASADLTMFHFVKFLAIATVGNAIGGVFFVAIIKYGHARSEN